MSGFSLTSPSPSSKTMKPGVNHVPNDLQSLLLCLVECCTSDGSDMKDKDTIRARYYPDIGRCPSGTHVRYLLEAVPLEPVDSYVSDTCNTCPRRSDEYFLYPSRSLINADRDAIVANPPDALAAIQARWKNAYEASRNHAVQEERRSALGTDAYNRPSLGIDRDREESRAWWLYLIAAYGIGRRIVDPKVTPSQYHVFYASFLRDCASDLVKRNEVRAQGAGEIMRCWCPMHQKPDAHLLPLLGRSEYNAQCGMCPIPRIRVSEPRPPIAIIRDIGSRIEAANQQHASSSMRENESRVVGMEIDDD